MTAEKPEIELEVSCGGTFKISTEAMACRITVLDNAVKGSAVQAVPQLDQETMAAPQPAAGKPEAPEMPMEDPFFREAVKGYCGSMHRILDDLAAAAGKALDEDGSAAAIAARTLPADTEILARQRLAEEGDAIAKAQATIVDQRFTLTFLKNHPIFSRRDPEAEEISVSSAELDTLHGKIKSALHTAALINDALAKIKDALKGEGDASDILTPIAGLIDGQRQMIDAFCGLQIMLEEREAEPTVTFAAARKTADDRLASLQEHEEAAGEGDDEAPDLSDQAAIDRLLNGSVADSAAGEEEEMSDEEALKKMQEFGL